MKFVSPSICFVLTLLALSSCATTKKSAPPSGPRSATLTISQFQAGYIGAAAAGSGRLDYGGVRHKFTIQSIGAGGVGAQRITATGDVYNLHSLAEFPGIYTGARSGLTLVKGKFHERLANERGVVIYLVGEGEGLSASLGLDKLRIAWE